MKRHKLTGIFVIILSILYPLLMSSIAPNHWKDSGDFLTYVFAPLLFVFGVLTFVNYKAGVYYARIIIGSVFIVSGLIKANDALGFSYKLEEYFEPGALGWTAFDPYALWIAILVCVGEIVIGLALLFGAKFKLTMVLLMAMLVFFAFLTFYTAQCDPQSTYTVMENGVATEKPVQCVLDCGCFGDALKGSVGRSLSPWESFYKDLVLLILALFMLPAWNKIKLNNERRDRVILSLSLVFISFFAGYIFGWWFPVLFAAACFLVYWGIKRFNSKPYRVWIIAGVMAIFSLGFALYTLYYLPIKDYRPYAIGNNIPELMKSSDDIKQEIIDANLESIMNGYTAQIDADTKAALASDARLLADTVSDSLKQVYRDEITANVLMNYENKAWAIADSIATDSMERANLFPPVYAVDYLLRHKETGEEKVYNSIEYLELKLWNDWNTVYQLKNKETGEIEKVLSNDYNMEEWEAKGYEKINPVSYKVKDGYEPKIPVDFDFNDEDVNQDILHSENYLLLVVAYELEHTDKKAFEKLEKLYQYAQTKGYSFYAGTSTDFLAEQFKKENNISFDFQAADEKILKTIVRSNPGLVLLKGGTVYGKWSKCSIPSADKLEKYIAKLK